jgi:peptidoglycan/LPS O-acetylase OafA/YrhL
MGLLRIYLALCVAGDHLINVVLDRHGFAFKGVAYWTLISGGMAVMLFYTISGFLISYVLTRKYDETAKGTLAFYRSRFIRIFSAYWPLLIILSAIIYDQQPRGLLDQLVSVFIIGGDWIVAFANYPDAHNPYLPVLAPVWSVAAELTFYAMAPFVLRSRSWTLVLFFASLVTGFALQAHFDYHQAWTFHFFPSVLWCFLAGDLARRLGEVLSPKFDWIGGAALVASIVLLALRPVSHFFFFPLILTFALSLPWLFDRTKDNRVLNFLGDLTYPIYLIHWTMLVLIFTPWADRFGISSVPIFVGAYVASLLIVGAGIHFLIERPFAAVLGRLAEQMPRLLRVARA